MQPPLRPTPEGLDAVYESKIKAVDRDTINVLVGILKLKFPFGDLESANYGPARPFPVFTDRAPKLYDVEFCEMSVTPDPRSHAGSA
jgi:hypothetical protein